MEQPQPAIFFEISQKILKYFQDFLKISLHTGSVQRPGRMAHAKNLYLQRQK
jgi:hypothetical protein